MWINCQTMPRKKNQNGQIPRACRRSQYCPILTTRPSAKPAESAASGWARKKAMISMLLSPYLIFGPRRDGSTRRRVKAWLIRNAHAAVARAFVVCKNSVGVTHKRLLRRTGKIPKSTSGATRNVPSLLESAVQSVIGPRSSSSGLDHLFYSLAEAQLTQN